MKIFLLLGSLLFSALSIAASGWTTEGNITEIEVVRAQGFMVKGGFGDAASCGTSDYLWVAIDHPQFDTLYSTVLAAYMSGKKIKAFAHECSEIGWHGGSYSTLNGAGSLYIKD